MILFLPVGVTLSFFPVILEVAVMNKFFFTSLKKNDRTHSKSLPLSSWRQLDVRQRFLPQYT